MKRILLLIALLFWPGIAAGSVLSNAAASLAVGSWVRVDGSMINWNNGDALVPAGCPNNPNTQFANAAVWNVITKRFQFSGSPHTACTGTNEKAIFYADSSDSWGTLPVPPASANDPRHSYDHNTINPITGEHYYTHYSNRGLYRLNAAGTTWTTLTPSPQLSQQCCKSQAYFIDRNSLLRYDGDWGIWEYFPATDTWTQRAQGKASDGSGLPQFSGGDSQPTFSNYSQRCRCILLGNGANFAKFNLDGTFTNLSRTNGPANIDLNIDPTKSSFVVDPVTGYLLVITPSAPTMYQFDPGLTPAATGTWSTVTTSGIPPFFLSNGFAESLISAPISTYGVIMYVKHNDSSSGQVWLYKHAATNAADLDFFRRRETNGVIRWFDFDTTADLPRHSPGNNEDWGHDFGVMPSGTGLPTIGTATKASGAGALHYVQALGSASDSAGSWFTHFGHNKTGQKGQGERIFAQYRVRWSPEMLVNSNWPSSGGAKIMDISLGDLPSCVPGDSSTCPTSCPSQGFEFVIQNNQQYGIPSVYANCNSTANFVPLASPTSPPGGSNLQNMVAKCTDASPLTTCVPFVANEWMTFQVMLQVGTWGTFSSPVKVWFAREGAASTLIIDCESGVTPSCTRDFAAASNGWSFANSDPANFKMGKIYLHPYQTGLSKSLASATIDYDELILSTTLIPDPGAAIITDTTPPTVQITSPTSSPTYAISGTAGTAAITLSGTAADDTGVSSITWTNNRGGSGTALGTTSWSASGVTLQPGANIITVTAVDAALNSAADVLTATYSILAPVTFKIQ
jgi:hypothetical protein